MSLGLWLLLLVTAAAGGGGAREDAPAGGRIGRSDAGYDEAFAVRFITRAGKGYIRRACGLDMNRNGIAGEAADRLAGDGKTRDPDGDGIDEDILYVDALAGSDRAGDGSPARPYRTIQKALDLADGPDDGAEDIICISGTFHETLTMKNGGVPGHYVRDGFQFPRNPAMIIGWDRDGDGEYPPHDPDDTAVLDGRRALAWAITSLGKLSHIEIAHLAIRDYGYRDDDGGAIKLFRWGSGSQSHIYVHDVEMIAINKGEKDASAKIVLSFWGGPMTHVAVMNNLVDEYSSYFCRGAPPEGAGRFRFQNNTLKMYGTRGSSFVTGWKLWGHHTGVEILDNVMDCNARAWRPLGHVRAVGVCQGTQRWTIRGNVLIDLGITLQPFAAGYPFERPLNEISIDRNNFRSTYDGWEWPPVAITIEGNGDAPVHQTVENATITNNFFSGPAGWGSAVRCGAGNGGGPQPGTVTIAGNTIYGPFPKGRAAMAIEARRGVPYRQESVVFKNNIIANVQDGLNLAVDYAPARWVADGNVYDPGAGFRWGEPRSWESVSFTAWRAATGQDARSLTGVPTFVDAAAGDLHLAKGDPVARRAGVDISRFTRVDIDGEPRSATRPVAGADCVAE